MNQSGTVPHVSSGKRSTQVPDEGKKVWEKLGVVHVPSGEWPWAVSHSTCPTPVWLKDGTLRVFLQHRDQHGIGRVGYVDLDPTNPRKILQVSSKPVLDIGEPGTFDENGVLATSIVATPGGELFMYYVGFELGTKIRYRLMTGLAISSDGGHTFRRYSRVPILERSDSELFFRGGPFCLHDRGRFRMWYVAGSAWQSIRGKEMPVYDIHYIESPDGLAWPTSGRKCLDYQSDREHGFGRPYVVKNETKLELYLSVRTLEEGYQLAYAESSDDGASWSRHDRKLGLERSVTGWDSETNEYAAVIRCEKEEYLFYNGNNFGETGFGVARRIQK